MNRANGLSLKAALAASSVLAAALFVLPAAADTDPRLARLAREALSALDSK